MYPGELDNNCLRGDFGDELSRNIQDGVDFVLIGLDIVDKLYKEYNKPPATTTATATANSSNNNNIAPNANPIVRFSRATVNTGTTVVPVWQIRLYPVRYESCLYDKATMTGKESKKCYYKSVVTLRDLKKELDLDSR